jgi:hypothetical protein
VSAAARAADERAAAERVGIAAAIAALERRVADERDAALAALAAVFGEGCALRSAGCKPEVAGAFAARFE